MVFGNKTFEFSQAGMIQLFLCSKIDQSLKFQNIIIIYNILHRVM